MLDSNEKRLARSDEGKRLLSAVHVFFTTFAAPIGNINLPMVLQALRWGWLDREGLTEKGQAALWESGYWPLGSIKDTAPEGSENG